MLTTTTEFDNAAVASIRDPRARVRIDWSGPIIDTGIVITPIDENNVSDKAHVANGVFTPDALWYLLDGNSDLNGDYKLFPTPAQTVYEVGWYGNAFSDGSGNFSTSQTLKVEFTTKAVFGIFIAGDSVRGEYPVDFTIDVKLSGVSQLPSIITVTGNTDVNYQTAVEVLEADEMLLTITKWSEPTAVAKILEFYSSIIRYYEGDVIKSIKVLEEREIRDSTNPIGNISANECTIELQNIEVDGIVDPFFPGNTDSFYHTLLKPGRRVEVEFGFVVDTYGNVEYVSMGTFWSGDFTIKEGSSTISFTARDRMEKLRKLTYEDNEVDTSQTYTQFLTDILTSAQVKDTELLYTIDTVLSSYTIPITFMNRVNYFEAIKTVVASVGGQAYMNRDDRLIIESAAEAWYYTGSPDLFITKAEYFSKDQPSRYEEIINKLEIETQPLEISASKEIVYQTSNDIDLAASAVITKEFVFNTFPVSGVTTGDVTLTGTGCTPTLTDSSFYSWGCILEITETAATTGTFSVEIEGYTYELKEQQVVFADNDTSILEVGEKVYQLPNNHLLQDADTAETIAENMIDVYYEPRNDLSLVWRGNPALELGDIIVVPEYQRGTINNRARFKVYKLQTDFDGTLKQVISGRRIDTYTP